MPDERLPKRVLFGHMDGSGVRGKSQKQWVDYVSEDMQFAGLSLTWWKEAQDRAGWRAARDCLLRCTQSTDWKACMNEGTNSALPAQGRRARFVDRDLVASGMRRLCVALSHQGNILHAAQQQQNMLEVLLHGILCKLQVSAGAQDSHCNAHNAFLRFTHIYNS